MTEPVVLTVKMVGADLAAKDTSGLADSVDRLSSSAKGAKTSAAEAAKSVDQVGKASKDAAKAADTAGKSQGGFFAGLREGWQKAKADATQSSSEIAKAVTNQTADSGEKQKGFFAGLKEGWDKAKEDAEEGGKKSGDGFLQGIKGKIASGFAALGIGAFLVSAVQSAMDSQGIQSQLEDAFSRFPKLADTNIAKIEELAAAREKLTRFDADSTKASVAQLAQMRLTGTQITQLIPLIQDYAAKTGKDLDSATKSVTDGFLGNTDALRDAGITFKSTGSAAYDYMQMIKALRAQVGGFAEKEGTSAAGKLEQLKTQFGNVKQEIGEALLPYAIKLGDWLKQTGIPAFQSFAEWIRDKVIPAIQSFVSGIGDVIDTFAPVVEYMTSAKGAWLGFTAVIAASYAVFAAHPVFAMAIVVANIIKGLHEIDNWNPLSPAARSLQGGNPDDPNYGARFFGVPGFASGTVLPGYSPGRDSIPAMLSPGEAVLVPELTRAIGPQTINYWNSAYSAGRRGMAFGGIAGTNPTYTRSPAEQDLFLSQLQSVFSLGSNVGASAAPQVSAVPSGDDPVQRWKNVAIQALQMTDQYTAGNLDAMMKRIGWESSGDPNAVNRWDKNAKRGTPSQGLMQVIPPTFKTYAQPGYDKNILDPLSNMLASINYAKATYGSLEAAYLRKNKNGGVAGYDQGGWLPPGGIAVSGLDKPEAVLTPDHWDIADRALTAAMQNGGGSTITVAPGAIVVQGVSDPEAAAEIMHAKLAEWLEEHGPPAEHQEALMANMGRRFGSPVAHFVLANGVSYPLVNTPEKLQTGGHAPVFASIERQGQQPLSVEDSKSLHTMQFTHTIAGPNVNTPKYVGALQTLASSGNKVRIVGMDPAVRGWWNIKELQVSVTKLTSEQKIESADLTWSLVEFTSAPIKIGRAVPTLTPAQKAAREAAIRNFAQTIATIVNGLIPTATSPSPTASYDYMINTTASGRKYQVHAGDTLRSIAAEQLGDASRWQEIADLNKSKVQATRGRDENGRAGWVYNLTPGLVLDMPAPSAPPPSTSRAGGKPMLII